jgi:hypothetical protein
MQINKDPASYYWYLKNSPVGLRLNKDNGLLTFRAEKSYFLSGKLKYDVNYKVNIGVQNLSNANEKVDTSFTIVFYNTEIIPTRVKTNVGGTIYVDEGVPFSIKVFCENGSFPFENLITLTSSPIDGYTEVKKCDQEFRWTPPYDFAKDTDPDRVKILTLSFIGTTKFQIRDTASVRLIVRDALNYPVAKQEYDQVVRNIERYVLQLKYTFLQLDRKLKKTKSFRTSFDLTSTATSLTGTILSTTNNVTSSMTQAERERAERAQRTGKILPSIGLSMVPIKEATVPNKSVDQNQASSIRASIKRLEYMVRDNMLLGEKDGDIAKKTNKLKDELKQIQVQLIDVPIELTNSLTEEELNRYFNSPKVNKKYRMKAK